MYIVGGIYIVNSKFPFKGTCMYVNCILIYLVDLNKNNHYPRLYFKFCSAQISELLD